MTCPRKPLPERSAPQELLSRLRLPQNQKAYSIFSRLFFTQADVALDPRLQDKATEDSGMEEDYRFAGNSDEEEEGEDESEEEREDESEEERGDESEEQMDSNGRNGERLFRSHQLRDFRPRVREQSLAMEFPLPAQ
ncbi:MAG: hypothetical protein Q9196_005485 [Gyalolechia fulgens]